RDERLPILVVEKRSSILSLWEYLKGSYYPYVVVNEKELDYQEKETTYVIVPVPGLSTRTSYPTRNNFEDLSSKCAMERKSHAQ
ncbi:hypothetical protein U1Q18_041074, partial [Sarracenia purpurea var. burkii]